MTVSIAPKLVLVSLALLGFCSAYPEDWAPKALTCTEHPTKLYGKHAGPVKDTSTTFSFLDSAKESVAELCPGSAYTLEVNLGSDLAEMYLTSSQGVFGKPFEPNGDCPNQVVAIAGWDFPGTVFTDSLTLDCSASGSVEVAISWGEDKTEGYYQSSVSVEVNPACAHPSCPGAPAGDAGGAAGAPGGDAAGGAPAGDAGSAAGGAPAGDAGSDSGAAAGGGLYPPTYGMYPPGGFYPPTYGMYPPVYGNKAPPSGSKAPPSGNKAPPSGNKAPPSGNKAPPTGKKAPPLVKKA